MGISILPNWTFPKKLAKDKVRETYVKLKEGVKQTLSLFCEYGFC
jgi:hypothetical protein